MACLDCNDENIPVGPQGPAGPQGEPGEDGASIELQIYGGYIQWRVVGDATWNNLVALAAITGPTGPPGATGPAGADGAPGVGITLLGSVETQGDLPGGASVGDCYIVNTEGNLYVWDGAAWFDAGQIVGPQGPQGIQGDPGDCSGCMTFTVGTGAPVSSENDGSLYLDTENSAIYRRDSGVWDLIGYYGGSGSYTVGAWQNLIVGTSAFTAGTPTAQYRIEGSSVRIEGVIKGTQDVITSVRKSIRDSSNPLASGFRPLADKMILATSIFGANIVPVEITTLGEVFLRTDLIPTNCEKIQISGTYGLS